MTTCPCCSNQILRHVRAHQIYWFCRHCWQDIPISIIGHQAGQPLYLALHTAHHQ